MPTVNDPNGEPQEVVAGRAKVNSSSLSAFARASEKGDAYSWVAVSADLAALDTALLVMNNDPNRLLRIQAIYCYADVPTQFKIHYPAYATFTGTAVTGKCLNTDLTKTALAVSYADETGNVFAAGNTIATLITNEVTTDIFAQWVNLDGAAILGYQGSIAVDVVADSAAFECTILGYYEDKE